MLRGLLDREDSVGRETGGQGVATALRWRWRVLQVELGALAGLEPSGAVAGGKDGVLGASGRGDCHALSALACGGARGGWRRGVYPGSKVSMTVMGPPQDGQG